VIANERERVVVGVGRADGPTPEGALLGENATPLGYSTPERDSLVVLSVVVVVVVGARAPCN